MKKEIFKLAAAFQMALLAPGPVMGGRDSVDSFDVEAYRLSPDISSAKKLASTERPMNLTTPPAEEGRDSSPHLSENSLKRGREDSDNDILGWGTEDGLKKYAFDYSIEPGEFDMELGLAVSEPVVLQNSIPTLDELLPLSTRRENLNLFGDRSNLKGLDKNIWYLIMAQLTNIADLESLSQTCLHFNVYAQNSAAQIRIRSLQEREKNLQVLPSIFGKENGETLRSLLSQKAPYLYAKPLSRIVPMKDFFIGHGIYKKFFNNEIICQKSFKSSPLSYFIIADICSHLFTSRGLDDGSEEGVIRCLCELTLEQLVGLASSIEKHGKLLFTDDMDDEDKAKLICYLYDLTSKQLDNLASSIQKHGESLFTEGMDGWDKVEILQKVSRLSPGEFDELVDLFDDCAGDFSNYPREYIDNPLFAFVIIFAFVNMRTKTV